MPKDSDSASATPRYAVSNAAFSFTARNASAWAGTSRPADGEEVCYDCLRRTLRVEKVTFGIDPPYARRGSSNRTD